MPGIIFYSLQKKKEGRKRGWEGRKKKEKERKKKKNTQVQKCWKTRPESCSLVVKLEFELRSDFKAQAFGHYSSGSQPLLYIKIDGDFFFLF